MLDRVIQCGVEFYSERLPYHPGKWRVIEAALRLGHIEKGGPLSPRIVDRDGLRWRLGTECAVQRRLFWHGGFDRADVAALFRDLKPGSVFFDIGACFGYYAVLAARRGARVYAFEPMPANFQLLTEHRDLNQLKELHPFQLALSDQNGSAAFSLPEAGNRGRGHLDESQAGTAVQVETMRLDDFVSKHAIDRIDALKLDVEGAELKVLAGGQESLKRFQPVLLVELNPPCLARFGASEQQLVSALRDLNYDLFVAKRSGLIPFKKLDSGLDYVNLICRPVEK